MNKTGNTWHFDGRENLNFALGAKEPSYSTVKSVLKNFC